MTNSASSGPRGPIPAYAAKLPSSEALSPYLRRLDDVRQYSNRGELNVTLASRLAAKMEVLPDHLTLTSSGTSALVAGILAAAGRASEERPLCLVPAYTFSATAAAAELCGYTIHLVDVDEDSWALDPSLVTSHALLQHVGLVLPVCPYGSSPLQAEWGAFSRTTGVPVVIDAAASFERLLENPLVRIGSTPVALSFHASKAFSTGEGGALVCTDVNISRSVARAINFGMLDERRCRAAGFNGKMSEYHAAVGLAELEGWVTKSDAFRAVADTYSASIADHSLTDRFIGSPKTASCYMLFQAIDDNEADAVIAKLAEEQIEHRLWYGRGLNREPYFLTVRQDALPVVDRIAGTLIGLPTALDLSDASVARVVRAVASVVRP